MEPVTRTVGKDVMILRLLDLMIIVYIAMTQIVQIVNAAVGGVTRKWIILSQDLQSLLDLHFINAYCMLIISLHNSFLSFHS